MSIIQPDLLVRTALEAGLADLRRNPWIVDDIFSGFATNDLSANEYGAKEVARARQWFLKNDVPVYGAYRMDLPTTPCIVVVDQGSSEMEPRASLADDGNDGPFDPTNIRSTPQYVYRPFTPTAYDPDTGDVTMPSGLDTALVVPGQFFVTKDNKAYQILECVSTSVFRIKSGLRLKLTQASIMPPTQLWNVRREQSFFRHTVRIDSLVSGDPVQALWLGMVVQYLLLRCKESFLEHRGFELSTFAVGPLEQVPQYNPETVFTRSITLVGQMEASWIKYIAPKLQSATAKIRIADGPRTPPDYRQEVSQQAWEMEADAVNDGPGLPDGLVDDDLTDDIP